MLNSSLSSFDDAGGFGGVSGLLAASLALMRFLAKCCTSRVDGRAVFAASMRSLRSGLVSNDTVSIDRMNIG